MALCPLRAGILSRSCRSSFLSKSSLRSPLAQSTRPLSDKARASIDAAVRAHPLVLFMKGTPSIPQCGFSRAVVQLLDLHDVPSSKLKTFNCLEDDELRQAIKEYSDWPTIPQVYIDGEFMGGCDTMMEMHRTGELSRVLASKSIVPSPKGSKAATS